ncbi:hypothetical protein DVR12_12955 [Chitinophaga silvatica]|uniref:Uncharacterized protein n=1 Tax=Chitinophaga silvatica TaxID=2282649 RepID=A0A3E1YAN1_9BACT|nr:hypothetical protein [Chitinophaga silvatica]RFS22696.1 hypothetical protein DVR12_12955 [Chitinophaga silvatica]
MTNSKHYTPMARIHIERQGNFIISLEARPLNFHARISVWPGRQEILFVKGERWTQTEIEKQYSVGATNRLQITKTTGTEHPINLHQVVTEGDKELWQTTTDIKPNGEFNW